MEPRTGMSLTHRWAHLSFGLLLSITFLPQAEVDAVSPESQRSDSEEPKLKRPNVIFVLADDLGIGDIQPTNPECKIATPNLAKLAKQGITFTDAHSSSSVCTPTRYGLLTGRYNWRSRLARGVLSGTSPHLIPETRATVGHLMKRAGYHTQMIGKWHLGWDWSYENQPTEGKRRIDFKLPITNGPDINGFDGYYAHCGSLDMPPYVWVDTGKATAIPVLEEGVTKQQDRYGWYRKGPIAPDFKIDEVLPHLFEKSMQYVNDRTSESENNQPFFLYLALPAPHTPIVPVPPFKDASGLNPYADFVMQVDHHIGELLETLEQQGVRENTLFVFSSDNGCSPEANFALLAQHDHHPSAGFRGHKADIYEGGHRVPLLASWPAVISPGQKTAEIACLTDFYATLADLTGQSKKDGGEDSHSWLPLFQGKDGYTRTDLISHSIGGFFSYRRDGWKLCLSAGSGGWSQPREADAAKRKLPPIQLFDLKSDPAEQINLQMEQGDKVKELIEELTKQVRAGRSTTGPPASNDRDVEFLPRSLQ